MPATRKKHKKLFTPDPLGMKLGYSAREKTNNFYILLLADIMRRNLYHNKYAKAHYPQQGNMFFFVAC